MISLSGHFLHVEDSSRTLCMLSNSFWIEKFRTAVNHRVIEIIARTIRLMLGTLELHVLK